MGMTYEEATARVTAPGGRFEIAQIDVAGVPYKAFVNAPPSMKDLFATARLRGDDLFLVYEDERWTFTDVMGQVDALGALLVNHYGVKKGDRVAIGMRNYPEWVIAFAAIMSVGAISVSLNAWWTEDEVAYALGDCTPSVLIADERRLEVAAPACDRLGIAKLGVRCGPTMPAAAQRWEDLVRVGEPLPSVDISTSDDATILYTSGTTGSPKGAVSTHGALLQSLFGFACRGAIAGLRNGGEPEALMELSQADRPVFILAVPLFHVTGCVAVMLSCFGAGLKLVMMHRWDPERALELIARERVTNFVGVPTQSWDLVECPRFADFDTSSLLSVGGGGAPAPPELVKRVASSFPTGRPSIGYGMTETNAYGPQNSGADYLERPTSTGRAAPILDIEVRDPDGHAVPNGERGEIWLKGPHLIRGYWGKPEATADLLVAGWLRTGDIGQIDDEGFVYVVDRAKDMVLRGGENVYCAEVEAAIYEHPAVYEAAVFGVPSQRLGEEVAAGVYLRPGHSLTVPELQEHLGRRLASFKIPTRVMLLDHPLPRNASGKVLKRQLRDDVAGPGSPG